MQTSEIQQITENEFFEKMAGQNCIINALGCVVSVSNNVDYEQKLIEELKKIDLEPNVKIERKRNKISDGITFGRCARSRSANNLLAGAQSLRQKYGKRLNPCFLTLTFPFAKIFYEPEIHDIIYCRCVQKFFKKLTAQKKVFDFLWIAERHTESERHTNGLSEFSVVGRLHFHAIVFFDGFANVQDLNDSWLNTLKLCRKVKFPIINENGEKYQPLDAEWLYKKNIRNSIEYSKLLAYINKYVKKQTADDKFYCRCWGWSRGLSTACGKQNVDFDAFTQVYTAKRFKRFYEITITCPKIVNDTITQKQRTESVYNHKIYVGQIDFKYINSNYLKYFAL